MMKSLFYILTMSDFKVLWGRVIVALLVLTAGCVLAKAHTNYNNDKKNTVEGLMTFCQWLKKSSNHGSCDYLVWSSVSSMSSFVNRHFIKKKKLTFFKCLSTVFLHIKTLTFFRYFAFLLFSS